MIKNNPFKNTPVLDHKERLRGWILDLLFTYRVKELESKLRVSETIIEDNEKVGDGSLQLVYEEIESIKSEIAILRVALLKNDLVDKSAVEASRKSAILAFELRIGKVKDELKRLRSEPEYSLGDVNYHITVGDRLKIKDLENEISEDNALLFFYYLLKDVKLDLIYKLILGALQYRSRDVGDLSKSQAVWMVSYVMRDIVFKVSKENTEELYKLLRKHDNRFIDCDYLTWFETVLNNNKKGNGKK